MKNIFDYSHVKSVSAQVLIDKQTKEIAGKIISNWSDNPAGSVCTSQVIIYDHDKYGIFPKKEHFKNDLVEFDTRKILIGKAGGYGYDKLSEAIANALNDNTEKLPEVNGKVCCVFGGAGLSAVSAWFDAIGLELKEII